MDYLTTIAKTSTFVVTIDPAPMMAGIRLWRPDR
jgi:hypothetical protein